MRIKKENGSTKIWLSANNTYDWAHRAGASWPCSQLSGNRVYVELDQQGDLVDFAINGKMGDCDNSELQAIIEDTLK